MANSKTNQFTRFRKPNVVGLVGTFILSGTSNASGSNLDFPGMTNLSCSQGNGSYVFNLSDRYTKKKPLYFGTTFFTSASHAMMLVPHNCDLSAATPFISCSLFQLSGTVVGGTTLNTWVKQAPSTVVTGSAVIFIDSSSP